MIVMSFVYNFQDIFTHTFRPNESASFLTFVTFMQVEIDLAERMATENKTSSIKHASNAVDLLSDKWIGEIAEVNERIANELKTTTSSLLNNMTQKNATTSLTDINEKVNLINDILNEAVSVRISQTDLNNSTVQALVVANTANEIYKKYADALGISPLPKALSYLSIEMDDQTMHSEKMDDVKLDLTSPRNITDISSYQTAGALTLKAKDLVNNELLNTFTANDTTIIISTLDQEFQLLKESIDNKSPFMDILQIIHGKIHPLLIKTFKLELM
jgi:hypothetical protein